MTAHIHHISVSVPPNCYSQDFMKDLMLTHVGGDRRTDMILRRVYSQSGIKHRHTVLNELPYARCTPEPRSPETFRKHFPDLEPDPDRAGPFEPEQRRFVNLQTGDLAKPQTGERNARYVTGARALFTGASQKLFTERPDLDAKRITHVITVSCTGFYAPGPDIEIIQALGLPPTTQRFHIGFMSCFAGFSALRLAQTICKAQTDAHVLLVSVELCTLHLRFKSDVDSILSNAVFADGGAAVYISNESPSGTQTALEVGELGCTITPTGYEHMAWTVGNHGFDMVLSVEIPDLIGEHLLHSLQPLLGKTGIKTEDIATWAVHPGGRAIVDKVERQMELQPAQVAASRAVLYEYGNMSSATIFFVLRHILENPESLASGDHILAMTFGPGISVEGGFLRYL